MTFEQELLQLYEAHSYILQQQLTKQQRLECYLQATMIDNTPTNSTIIFRFFNMWFSQSEQSLGYQFKQWLQSYQDIDQQLAQINDYVDQLALGKVQECLSNFKSVLNPLIYDKLITFNFTPEYISQQYKITRQQLQRMLLNAMEVDKHAQNLINIIKGQEDLLIQSARKDWRKFILLNLQFNNYEYTKQDLINLVQTFQDYSDDMSKRILKIAVSPDLVSALLELCQISKPHLSFYLLEYLEAETLDIQKYKRQICYKIIVEISPKIQNLHLILSLSRQIEEWNKIIQDSFDQDIEQLLKDKLLQIIENSNNFDDYLQIINNLPRVPLKQQQKCDFMKKIFQVCLNNPPLEQQQNDLDFLNQFFQCSQKIESKLASIFLDEIMKLLRKNELSEIQGRLFKQFLSNFNTIFWGPFPKYMYFSVLQILAVKYCTRLQDFSLDEPNRYPDILILHISKEFIEYLFNLPYPERRRKQLQLSRILQDTESEQQAVINKKQIVSLALRKL